MLGVRRPWPAAQPIGAVAPTDHEQVGLGLDGDRQRLEELEPAVHGVHRHVVRHTANCCLHERERSRPAAGCGVDDDCDPTGARLGRPVLLHGPTSRARA